MRGRIGSSRWDPGDPECSQEHVRMSDCQKATLETHISGVTVTLLSTRDSRDHAKTLGITNLMLAFRLGMRVGARCVSPVRNVIISRWITPLPTGQCHCTLPKGFLSVP